MSGPMGPERLALLREHCDDLAGVTDGRAAYSVDTVAELLADRDHWEAEAKRLESLRAKLGRMVEKMMAQRNEAIAEAQRWRARCPVTAEDVKRAGVTLTHAKAWGAVRNITFLARDGFVRFEQGDWGWTGLGLHELIMTIAEIDGRPAHDILDEMAAEVSP